ncbi:hypothetical protein [Benzoatithermus flavus]|uniref:DUF1127 domain-containing protein n=1 Tax=Benzoatithermus flavus TaxID=3108223 RepID=A0ABU8XXD8_9PROT
MDLLETIQRLWYRQRAFRAMLAQLESHSDRELMRDLRLTRADLPQLAYEEAARRAVALARRQTTAAKLPVRPHG